MLSEKWIKRLLDDAKELREIAAQHTPPKMGRGWGGGQQSDARVIEGMTYNGYIKAAITLENTVREIVNFIDRDRGQHEGLW